MDLRTNMTELGPKYGWKSTVNAVGDLRMALGLGCCGDYVRIVVKDLVLEGM